jgi:hypothetical protein
MSYNIIIRVVVIIIGIVSAYVFYSYFIEPSVLYPLCITNSETCNRMAYYKYKNSVLIKMQPSGYWIWYNGDNAFIYGQPTGIKCDDPSKYEPGFAINTKTGQKIGYQCIQKLDQLLSFYEKQSSQEFVYDRMDNPSDVDVYYVLNLFNKKGIISI